MNQIHCGTSILKCVPFEFEVGEAFSVPIFEEIDGFGIRFGEVEYWDNEKDDLCFPDVKSLVCEVKEVMKELEIPQPEYFVLHLLSITPSNRPQSAFNFVDRGRQKFYVGLSIEVIGGKAKIKSRHHLYHELMHIKDIVCGRFPTIGRGVRNISLINFLWGFSIEGRLERMGKPHLEREEMICLHKDPVLHGLISREHSEKFCNELWGEKVTYEQLKLKAEELIKSRKYHNKAHYLKFL